MLCDFPHLECGYQPDKLLSGCLGATNSLLRRNLPAAYHDGIKTSPFVSPAFWIVKRKHWLAHAGVDLPRGSRNISSSSLPSARKVSWQLHHDTLYPSGHIGAPLSTLGSDPSCSLELRFGGCDSCTDGTCRQSNKPKTCEFNQPCPNDRTTAAKLGGNGALVTHMVRLLWHMWWDRFCDIYGETDFVTHIVRQILWHTYMVRKILWHIWWARFCVTYGEKDLSVSLSKRWCSLVSLLRTHFRWPHKKVVCQKKLQSDKRILSELDCCNSQNPECFNIDIRLIRWLKRVFCVGSQVPLSSDWRFQLHITWFQQRPILPRQKVLPHFSSLEPFSGEIFSASQSHKFNARGRAPKV